MKKTTLMIVFLILFCWTGYAQFSCNSAVVLTDGFSQMGITTPGNDGPENWVNEDGLDFAGDHPDPIDTSYFTDDVYLFTYTADSDEEIIMTIKSRKEWNGIAVFSECAGNVLTGYIDGVSNTSEDEEEGKSVRAILTAGQTVYIAVGQWGSPYELDFDVLSFSVAPMDQLPNCMSALRTPAVLTDVSTRTNIAWNTMAGGILGYKLSIGTDAGLNDILDSFDVGNVTSYTPAQPFDFATTYYVTVAPYNAIGGAESCEEISFTTEDIPAPGNLCENPILITSFPYTTTDDTANYSSEYYEGSPGGEDGCGSTSNYLNGNDVVYSFTATTDGTYNIELISEQTWVGAFIYTSCGDIGQNCYAGEVNSSAGGVVFENFQAIAEQTYYLVISSYPSPQTIQYTLNITENTCANLTASYAVVSDCENGAQFKIKVNITDMGSATSIIVSDNQSSEPITVIETGEMEIGPYSNGTSVIVTAANADDANCFKSSSALTQTACPPVNNDCAAAIALTPGADFEINPLVGTIVNATTTPGLSFDCQTSSSQDVWYTVEVPVSGSVTIETRRDGTSPLTDTVIGVFVGDCSVLTPVECGDDNEDDAFSTVLVEDQEPGTILYIAVRKWNSATEGTFLIAAYDESLRTCQNHTISYTVVDDCENNQFSVDVDVTSLGSATSLLISDNQASTPVTATATGIISFGPYATGALVIITAANTDDSNCVKRSNELSTFCAPINDDCSAAIALTPAGNFTAGAVTGSLISAATTAELSFECQENSSQDVWYTVEVPASGSITIETRKNGTSPLTDTVIGVFVGDCSVLTPVGCEDDNDDDNFSTVIVEDQEPGTILYIAVRKWNNATEGTFLIAAYDPSLGNTDFETANFSVYPNPVKEVLNVSYIHNISNVEVYNLVGQQVIAAKMNTTLGQVNMSHLPTGTYFVKVTSDNKIKTIKVVKQ